MENSGKFGFTTYLRHHHSWYRFEVSMASALAVEPTKDEGERAIGSF